MVRRKSRSSPGHSTITPSPRPSTSKAPISVPVVMMMSSLLVPAQQLHVSLEFLLGGINSIYVPASCLLAMASVSEALC